MDNNKTVEVLEKALEREQAVTASLLRYIEALEQNLDFHKKTVRELREQLEELIKNKESTPQ